MIGADHLTGAQPHALHPLTGAGFEGHGFSALAELGPLLARRSGQRRGQATGVDRVVAEDLESQAHGRSQSRLEPASLAAPQTLDPQPQGAAHLQLAFQGVGFVAVASQEQRAARVVTRIDARGPLELGYELRVALGRPQSQVQDAALGQGHLGDRSQHAGGHVRGAAARRITLEHDHAQAPLSRAPGD